MLNKDIRTLRRLVSLSLHIMYSRSSILFKQSECEVTHPSHTSGEKTKTKRTHKKQPTRSSGHPRFLPIDYFASMWRVVCLVQPLSSSRRGTNQRDAREQEKKGAR